MKKLYSKFALAAIAGVLAAVGVSCSSDEEASAPVSDTSGITEISLEVPPPADSRTTLNATDLIKWNSGDRTKVGLWYSYSNETPEGTYSSHVAMASSSIELSESNKSAKFGFASANAIDAIYYAFYPYTSSFSRYSLPFTVANEQTQTAAGETTFGSASVPMISNKLELNTEVAIDGKEARILTNMHVLSSIVEFYVYDSNGSTEEVVSIELSSSNDKKLAGETKIDATQLTGIPALEGTIASAKVTLTTPFSLNGVTAKNQSQPIYLSVVPNEGVEGEIKVETDKAIYFFKFSSPKSFIRANVKSMTLNLSNAAVDRLDKSAYVKPEVRYTKLVRKSNQATTVTVKRLNDAAVGFYIFGKIPFSNQTCVTYDEVMNGSVYRFGAEDNDANVFSLQSDGTVVYKVPAGSYTSVTWGVVAFDKYGMFGTFKYESGYGIGSGRADVTSGFDFDY